MGADGRGVEANKRTKSLYRPLSHLCPTSIICECLFSDAKHIMTADRRHMDPSTLEMLLILKYNKDLWSAQTIDNIMNSDTSQLTGQKRALPASIASVDRDSDCASASELDCSF